MYKFGKYEWIITFENSYLFVHLFVKYRNNKTYVIIQIRIIEILKETVKAIGNIFKT